MDAYFYLPSREQTYLKRRRGRPPAVDLPVKDGYGEQRAGQAGEVGLQHRGIVGAREGPADVAGGVADVGANGEGAATLVVHQSSEDDFHNLR